ncbi:LysR family transcriptional regulator [Amycolatopsis jejuensis]|uniref:LysR family transcriptional regulator n=1 Tax=Amycolatopsis jejuensis TaxID=330084 RepID=UPI000527980C|nr:LysR family transcriptional regulator [Amycolatopsis jejuensis]
MDNVDLNLVIALDALLTENSVTAAAARLHTSAPAMSRVLGRLRRAFDDPLLVRAGRNLVPTPRALELRAEVHAISQRARALFEPSRSADPRVAVRTFDLQITDVLSTTFTPALIDDIRAVAPGISMRLRPETIEDLPALREGVIDLEVGVIENQDPEIRAETLSTEMLVGAARADHPLAKARKVTPARFAAADHLVVSRRGRAHGPIDDRLAALGLNRRVLAVVPTFAMSLLLARKTPAVCVVPSGLSRHLEEEFGLRTFPIPFDLPPVPLGMAWHPRNENDRTHQWLRDRVRTVMAGLS